MIKDYHYEIELELHKLNRIPSKRTRWNPKRFLRNIGVLVLSLVVSFLVSVMVLNAIDKELSIQEQQNIEWFNEGGGY